jgi:hypothetical protein
MQVILRDLAMNATCPNDVEFEAETPHRMRPSVRGMSPLWDDISSILVSREPCANLHCESAESGHLIRRHVREETPQLATVGERGKILSLVEYFALGKRVHEACRYRHAIKQEHEV